MRVSLCRNCAPLVPAYEHHALLTDNEPPVKATSNASTHFVLCLAIAAFLLPRGWVRADDREDALQSMKKGAEFYRSKIASHGGYVYYYSEDLKQRWGEGRATADTIFVQPPGTPTVGMAYLKAYEATHDPMYLDAATEAAEALVYGQLQSGGWTQVIHYAPAERLGKYRHGKGGSWNSSTLDDGQTQSALQMLARLDGALRFKHAKIHEAALFGFDALLKAQFPNGAFPQVWTKPVEPHPIVKPKYPDYDWRTEGRVKNYWDYYTLNDNLAGSVSETLITAHQVYGDAKYKAALERLGDFLLLAQMPDPQPGWCQQYSYDMIPIWARKFEPPAVTAWESQDVMEVLIKIANYTGNKKYLEPIPRGLEYFQKCLLPDGRVARYYELKTNKPLYMDQQYQLTYDDSAVPEHYGWKQSARFDEIRAKYEQARSAKGKSSTPQPTKPSATEVRQIIDQQDSAGRWVSTFQGERLVGQPKFPNGFRYISSDVFSHNIDLLSRFVSP
jgi:PelA/Pel-15E family pectate lyase